MVYGLIGKHSAIEPPGSSPRSLVVVALGPAPANAGGGHHNASQPTCLNRVHEFLDRRVVTVLVHDESFDASFTSLFNNPSCIVCPQGERLFYQDMFPASDARDRNFSMRSTGCQHNHEIDIFVIQHFANILVPRDSETVCERFTARGILVCGGHQLCVRGR